MSKSESDLKDQIGTFHEHGIYIPRRTIEILGDITEEKFHKVLKNLHTLDGTTGTINILISTDGGCVDSAKGIYDAIKGCRNYVRAMCYGPCMSSGTLILQAADERLCSPNTKFMIHYGELNNSDNTVVNAERWHEDHLRDKKWMEDVYFNQIKKVKKRYPRHRLQKLLEHDTIMSAKEFIELGLVDKVIQQYE